MATFKIESIGGTNTDHCLVYDNGNQQCHLMVSIDFEDILDRPLSSSEAETLKLAAYDDSTFYDQLALPFGMTSSSTKNQFDTHPDNVRSAQPSPAPKGVAETFDFYVSSTVVGSEKLMAVVKVHDDETGQEIVYTTHSEVGGFPFESSVTVTTEPALRISAEELRQISPATRSTTSRSNYIWELPTPLRIFERALEIDGLWDTDVDQYLYYRDLDTGGINSVHECMATTQQNGTFSFTDGRHLDFSYTDSQFGSGRCYIADSSISGNLSTPDEQQKVRLLDSYGTHQNYTLDGDSSKINIR